MVNYHYKVNSFVMIRADAYVRDAIKVPVRDEKEVSDERDYDGPSSEDTGRM